MKKSSYLRHREILSLTKQRNKLAFNQAPHKNCGPPQKMPERLGYLLRVLILSLVKNGLESKDFLLRMSAFWHFKKVWLVEEEFLSLNHSLIKEIMSRRKKKNNKYLWQPAHPAASEQVTIQLF